MKELKQYYRAVASWLPCGGRLKTQLMASISSTVENYLAAHPNADFPALQAHFGTPQQIAAAFVDEMDTSDLLDELKVRRKVVRVALTCAVVALLVWTVAIVAAWFIGIFGNGITELVIHH